MQYNIIVVYYVHTVVITVVQLLFIRNEKPHYNTTYVHFVNVSNSNIYIIRYFCTHK